LVAFVLGIGAGWVLRGDGNPGHWDSRFYGALTEAGVERSRPADEALLKKLSEIDLRYIPDRARRAFFAYFAAAEAEADAVKRGQADRELRQHTEEALKRLYECQPDA